MWGESRRRDESDSYRKCFPMPIPPTVYTCICAVSSRIFRSVRLSPFTPSRNVLSRSLRPAASLGNVSRLCRRYLSEVNRSADPTMFDRAIMDWTCYAETSVSKHRQSSGRCLAPTPTDCCPVFTKHLASHSTQSQ